MSESFQASNEADTGSRGFGGVAAALSVAVGGGVAVVGSFLPWTTNPSGVLGIEGGSIPTSFRASEFPLGIAALSAAALVAFVGLLWLATPRVIALASSLAVLGSIVILASAGIVLSTLEDRFVEIAAETSANPSTTTAEILDFLPRFLVANDVTIEPGVGLYLALGGGLLSLLGGIVGIVRSRRGR